LILKKGIPLAQTSLVEFGSWTIFTGMISRLGTTSMAAHEIALKIKLIKNIQSLPEEVVIKFIKSKGKLIRTKEGKLKIACKIKRIFS